jgi:hypothetical protein
MVLIITPVMHKRIEKGSAPIAPWHRRSIFCFVCCPSQLFSGLFYLVFWAY